ncbi:MAG: putative bifunctional diguanylate cyclase/phosphodiesterase, partial [Actinomycetota bacterium]
MTRVSSFPDETSTLRSAVTAASEVLQADGGAIMRGDAIVATPDGIAATHPTALRAAARAARLDAAGGSTLAVQIEDGVRLVLLRARPFDEAEARLLRAMSRMLMLAVHSMRALERERKAATVRATKAPATELAALLERQALLERLGRAQRFLARRGSMRQTLDAAVAAASELLGDEIVVIRLIEENEPGYVYLAAARGVEPRVRAPVGNGISGRAISSGGPVALYGPDARTACGLPFGDERIASALAAPLDAGDGTIGAIISATRLRERRYSKQEIEMFMVLSEAAAIALADARVAQAAADGLHDALTSLPSRSLFVDRLRHALTASQRSGKRAGVLAIDLDRFALINDGFGQLSGDAVLVEVAERIRRCLRVGDTASRFGGDEFGVVVENIEGLTDVIPVAGRILEALRAPIAVGGRDISLGGSIGIVVAAGGESAEELMRFAAVAMHEAKSGGRNRYEVFEQGMHERLVSRVALQADLERAIPGDELSLYYQPVVSLADGSIKGFEALIRWRHPERGLILPDTFVPLAEDIGAIVAIDRWVL